MTLRILALTRYLLRSLLFSLAGLLYLLLALAFYMIFFDPRQQTPDVDYYVLVIGLFGIVLASLVTLTVAARANRAVHFPFLVRLPSRVEYLTAVLLAAYVFATIVQALVALLALAANGPAIGLGQVLEIPPLWIAGNILFIVLALHASDLVTAGWSRVYVFGVLGVLLYLQSGISSITQWLSGLISGLGESLLSQGWVNLSTAAFEISDWIATVGSDVLETISSFIFWPFSAVAEATVNGYFSPTQALAPAIVLLYATILFMLAADFFATKDLHLTE